jgi:hypothetical protein
MKSSKNMLGKIVLFDGWAWFFLGFVGDKNLLRKVDSLRRMCDAVWS